MDEIPGLIDRSSSMADAPQWPIITSLILPAVTNEFNVAQPPLLTLAQNIGLLTGAVFWGFSADIIGRKWGFVSLAEPGRDCIRCRLTIRTSPSVSSPFGA